MCRWHCLSANMCLYLLCVLYVVCTCTKLKQPANTQTKEQMCRGNKCGMFCKSPAAGPASSPQISQQNEVHGCQRAKTSERESAVLLSATSTTCGRHSVLGRCCGSACHPSTQRDEQGRKAFLRLLFSHSLSLACPFLFLFVALA